MRRVVITEECLKKPRKSIPRNHSSRGRLNGIAELIIFFCKRRYFPDYIYQKIPAVAILASIIFFFSSDVRQLFLGKLGTTFLAAYGIVILSIRVWHFGK